MIQVVIANLEGTTEQEVDVDIQEFNEWFQGLGNDPLVRSEVAIIKTYLAWKLGLKKG